MLGALNVVLGPLDVVAGDRTVTRLALLLGGSRWPAGQRRCGLRRWALTRDRIRPGRRLVISMGNRGRWALRCDRQGRRVHHPVGGSGWTSRPPVFRRGHVMSLSAALYQ
ncbi:MAG: hypothetical protein C0482_26305 [Gordonia sp.]|nr:hypothetical protein [Gordonia sp. (in: high G+C Gram-positive bacteria)]